MLTSLFPFIHSVWRIYLNQPSGRGTLDIYPRGYADGKVKIYRSVPKVDWPDGDPAPTFTTITTTHWDNQPSRDIGPGEYFDVEVRFYETEFKIFLNGEDVITHTDMHIPGKFIPEFHDHHIQGQSGNLQSCFFTLGKCEQKQLQILYQLTLTLTMFMLAPENGVLDIMPWMAYGGGWSNHPLHFSDYGMATSPIQEHFAKIRTYEDASNSEIIYEPIQPKQHCFRYSYL